MPSGWARVPERTEFHSAFFASIFHLADGPKFAGYRTNYERGGCSPRESRQTKARCCGFDFRLRSPISAASLVHLITRSSTAREYPGSARNMWGRFPSGVPI
jgi:hypothetical protein